MCGCERGGGGWGVVSTARVGVSTCIENRLLAGQLIWLIASLAKAIEGRALLLPESVNMQVVGACYSKYLTYFNIY